MAIDNLIGCGMTGFGQGYGMMGWNGWFGIFGILYLLIIIGIAVALYLWIVKLWREMPTQKRK